MPDHQPPEVTYRCPVCMLKGLDPALRFDRETGDLYCQGCCYTGKEIDIPAYYELIKRRYRQIRQRIKLKAI